LIPFLDGCGSLTSTKVETPKVDPQAAAAAALEAYDKDADRKLNESELAACPAIQRARAHYDKDSDRMVSEEEIAKHLEEVLASGAGLLEVKCTVTRGGLPLPGATVRFVPEPFLGDAVQPAVGTTDPSGIASLSLAPEQLPENLRSAQLMQVGIYKVEIEHPSLPANAQRPLGFEVDPTLREGSAVRFNL
jgi:hypothetical protein